MPRLLYISPGKSTFVEKDIRLLSTFYQVDLRVDNWYRNPYLIPIRFIFQFFFLLFHIRRYQSVIVMFGGYWSLNPSIVGKLLKRKVIIIAGGTDCVSYPAINYGSLRKPVLKKVIGWSFKHASVICPVDDSLVHFKNSFYDESLQGIKYYFPKIETNVRVIYNGYEAPLSSDINKNRKRNSFVLLAFCNTKERFLLKGIDVILRNAAYFPDAAFTIGGVSNVEKYFPVIPKNVSLIGPLKPQEVTRLFSENEFVLQISISEGFPNALCEAMSQGCIPISSPVGAMPVITGNTGFTMLKRTDEDFQNVVKSALSLSMDDKQSRSVLASERIATCFTEVKRMEQLIEVSCI